MQLWFWLCALISLVLLAVMSFWSFPFIAREAGGLAAFDLRFFGYSAAQGQAFLAALSEDGRAFYLSTQHRLDFVFPVFLTASMMLAGALLFRALGSRCIQILALMYLSSDFLENRTIAAMLRMPDGQDSAMVDMASLWTMAKFSLIAILLVCLALGLFARIWGANWAKRQV